MKKLIPCLVIFTSLSFITSCKKDDPDPVVKTMTLTATKDASIFNGGEGSYNDYASGGSDLLRVGYSYENGYVVRTLVTFDVSSIPKNAKIVSASLIFTIGKSGSNIPEISVHKLTQDWTEGSTTEVEGCDYNSNCNNPGTFISEGIDVTWSHAKYNEVEWSTPGGAFVSTASASNPNGGLGTFTSEGLINDVKSWIATPTSNFGWILKVDEDNLASEYGQQVRYLSKNATESGASATTKPSLLIVYQQ